MNILSPEGPIGAAQREILLGSVAIMLAIVVPTIIAIAAFAFWFRHSNTKATYRPDWAYSGQIELVVWSIPALTVLLLGGVAWIGAQTLDPAQPIKSSKRVIDIQVVSLDWKWLFIYPDRHVAAVNTLTIPINTPVHFMLTSSSVMNAFFIPQLGSMIYTMNGMTTNLNLQGDKLGTFGGLSSHFSGDGFAAMRFDVNVVSDSDYDAWAQTASRSGDPLNAETYQQLAKPSMSEPPRTFRLEDVKLFDAIVSQDIPPAPGLQVNNTIEQNTPVTSGHAHVR